MLKEKFGTAQSTTLGIINRLEQKGLVTTCLTQQRTKSVKITQSGEELLPPIEECIAKADELMMTGFTQGERTLFIEFLTRAENNFLLQHKVAEEEES